MKKIKNLVVGLIACIIFVVGIGTLGYLETHYKKSAEITEVYIENGEAHFVCVDGWYNANEWEFLADRNDFEVGDVVVLTIDTNFTDNTITDDIIVNVKKGK